MTPIRMLLDPQLVNAYLLEHGLAEGYAPIEAALVQYEGAYPSGHPAVMLVIDVDGKKVLAKITLRLLEATCVAMRAASGVPRDAP